MELTSQSRQAMARRETRAGAAVFLTGRSGSEVRLRRAGTSILETTEAVSGEERSVPGVTRRERRSPTSHLTRGEGSATSSLRLSITTHCFLSLVRKLMRGASSLLDWRPSPARLTVQVLTRLMARRGKEELSRVKEMENIDNTALLLPSLDSITGNNFSSEN